MKMKVTRVQYTVDSGFVEANKKNVAAVMDELRKLKRDDVKYACYLMDDGKTFMHLAHHNSEAAEDYPTSLKSFEAFQEQLGDHLEIPPEVEHFNLVKSSFELF